MGFTSELSEKNINPFYDILIFLDVPVRIHTNNVNKVLEVNRNSHHRKTRVYHY